MVDQMPGMRMNIPLKTEIKEILVADIVLIIAFSLTLVGGIFGAGSSIGIEKLLLLMPIMAVAVTLSFVLHELMHKFSAQHYGAIAAFRTSKMGLGITLITGIFGFLLGIPGATVIYASNFTRRENGIVSLAGPLTNFTVFAVVLAIYLLVPLPPYFALMAEITLFISILLAFFNMLPINPLDGSKVLAWNKGVYMVAMGIIFVLTGLSYYLLFGNIYAMLEEVVFMIFIAFIFSMFYRGMF